MLEIKKGEPWIMWPNLLADNFIENPANHIFDHTGNFKFRLVFELIESIEEKSTLFAKLPSYLGFDLEKYGFLVIITEAGKDPEYIPCNYEWEINKSYELIFKKIDNVLSVVIDDVTQIVKFVKNELASDKNSHIIFGAGNFPKNGFNLNYARFNLHCLEIFRDGELISNHSFEEFIYNKSYDTTGNCNFIHKI